MDITPEALSLAKKEVDRILNLHTIVPPHFIHKERMSNIFLGRWAAITPSCTTAIAYLSLLLLFLFDNEVDLLAKIPQIFIDVIASEART